MSQARATRRTSRRKGKEDGGDAAANASAASAAAADGAGQAVPPLTLDSSALQRSVAFPISKRHPIALQHCLRHVVANQNAQHAFGAKALLSPAAPSPRALLASPSSAPASSAAPSAPVTLPLQEPSLGIRSLLFARTRPWLVITTADCLFVWQHPALGGSSEQVPESANVAEGGGGGWQCITALAVRALRRSSSSAAHLPCPFSGCHAAREADEVAAVHERRGDVGSSSNGNDASSSSSSSVRVCFSPDERVLFVAVNEPARTVAASSSPATPATPAAAGPFGSPAARSPAPRSSAAAMAGRSSSPAPSSSFMTPAKQAFSPPPASSSTPSAAVLGGSPNIERAFDALFANMDEPEDSASTPTAAAVTTVAGTQTQPTQLVTQTASATAAASETPSKSATKRSRPKRKFTGPEGGSASKTATVLLPPSFTVYALQLDAPVPSVPASPRPAACSPAVAAAAPVSEDDMLMSSMLSEMNAQLASPQLSSILQSSRGNNSSSSTRGGLADTHEHASSSCGHLRTLFCTTTAVTALLALDADHLVVGDALGAVRLWGRSSSSCSGSNGGNSGAWIQQRTLMSPPAAVASVVSLALLDAAEEAEAAAADDGSCGPTLLVTRSNADAFICDVRQGCVLSTLSASLHSERPALDEKTDVFVASPTLSATPSESPLRQNSFTEPSLDKTIIAGEATVHAAVPLVALSGGEGEGTTSSSLQLAMLVSPPKCDQALGAAASSPAASSVAPARKSARKLASSAPALPAPPCPSSLPSMVALHIHRSSAAGESATPPLIDVRKFPVPLLLSDDNPSVHATAVASSCGSQQQLCEKKEALLRLPSSTGEPIGGLPPPPSLLAFGLSSGALLLHSAASGQLVAMLSDGSSEEGAAEELPFEASQHSATAGAEANAGLACDSCATYASAFDEQQFALQQPMRSPVAGVTSSQSPASQGGGILSQLFSPVPSASPQAPTQQRASQRKASPRRSSRPPIALSPPPSSMPASAAAAAPTTAAAERKHLCTRAVTALAFHPRFHALLALGDQRGHVHVFAPATSAAALNGAHA